MRRIEALDGIRGVAIALVLLDHIGPTLHGLFASEHAAMIFTRLVRSTWTGVDVFFVLSGFLITGILLKLKGEPNFWSVFYIKRVFRILPVLLLVFTPVAFWLVRKGNLPLPAGLLLLTPLANLVLLWRPLTPFIFPLWSLAAEEQFYVVWPFAVRRLSQQDVFRAAMSVAVLSALLHATGAWITHANPIVLYIAPPTHLFGIALGSALAAAMAVPAMAAKLPKCRAAAITLGVALLVGAFLLGGYALEYTEPKSGLLAIMGTSLITAALVAGAVQGGLAAGTRRLLTTPALRWLGARSYAIYLLHPVVRQAFVASWSGRHKGLSLAQARLDASATFLGIMILIFLLAELSWRVVESPALRIGSRLTHRGEALLA